MLDCVDAHSLLSITLQFIYLVFLLKKKNKKQLNKSVYQLYGREAKASSTLGKATRTPNFIY